MPLNFRSALHITAGNSTAAMRQTGARALWWNEREHSPHSVSWRAPAVICPHSSLGRCHHSKWHRVLQAQNQIQTFFLRGQRAHLVGLAGHCSHTALAAGPPPFPDTHRPARFTPRDRAVSAFRTGNFEPRQKRLSGHFSLKGNEFFLKEHQVKVGAVLSPVLSTF